MMRLSGAILWGAIALAALGVPAAAQPTPTWTTVAPLPTPVASVHNVTAVNGAIYVFGGTPAGCCSLTPTDKVQRYDPDTNTWTLVSPLPSPRVSTSVAAIGNTVYVFGGEVGYNPRRVTNTVWKYDTTTDTWTTGLRLMPTARTGAGAAAIGGKVYVFGGVPGFSGQPWTRIIEVYDPATDTWTAGLTPMPRAAAEFAFAVVGTKVFMIGGTGGTSWTTVDEYDAVTDRWTTRTPMPSPRRAPAAAVLDGHVFIVGGTAPDCANPTVMQEYDPVADTWTARPPLSLGRYGLMAAALDGAVYAIGGMHNPGCSAGSPIGLVERYDVGGAVSHIDSLVLHRPLVSGCLDTRGRVVLAEAAPAGGVTVALHSDNPHVVVPASVVVEPGARSRSFAIATSPVVEVETARIEASLPRETLSAVLRVKPIGPALVTLTPDPVVGGATVAGRVTLQCRAVLGDVLVWLSSSDPGVAMPSGRWVIVPEGRRTGTFVVETTAVAEPTAVVIKARANGASKHHVLHVVP